MKNLVIAKITKENLDQVAAMFNRHAVYCKSRALILTSLDNYEADMCDSSGAKTRFGIGDVIMFKCDNKRFLHTVLPNENLELQNFTTGYKLVSANNDIIYFELTK